MDERIVETLKLVGLSVVEINTYLALLKNPNSTAYSVAKNSNMYKSNVYDALRSLSEKGLATTVQIKDKQFYTAASPERLIKIMEDRTKKIEVIASQLETSDKREGEVAVFEGINDFFEQLYNLLKQNEPIYVFDIPPYVPQLIEDKIMDFHKERAKKNIWMHHIYDYDATSRISMLNKLPVTSAKTSATKRHSLVSTISCGNTTLIVNWKKGLKIVKIVDKEVAETYKQQYKTLANL